MTQHLKTNPRRTFLKGAAAAAGGLAGVLAASD
jgi:hypothetical protein